MKLSAPGFVHPKNPIGPLRAAAGHRQQAPGLLGEAGTCTWRAQGLDVGHPAAGDEHLGTVHVVLC